MEPRPPSARSPDVCFGDWDCVQEQRQWDRDHPNGEIPEWEQRAMDEYAEESSRESRLIREVSKVPNIVYGRALCSDHTYGTLEGTRSFSSEGKGDAVVEVKTHVEKPMVSLVGVEENIYALLGKVSGRLEEEGLFDEADEFVQRAIPLSTYSEVLTLSQDYVQFQTGG